ncbi:lysophospholipid acyltransferase family protein [Legionella pneumophila]|uniref:Lipid A biosynthesis lauroyl acyltransferase n=1 Tax=Legionella pneumophila subsp. pascullei TaxID=91890 RepID=A0AAX2ITN3_LEGPN|nr:lysophospholipid acyltransferase family protein [Legionella pneumophila]AMP88517.1 lipid A biosynthesis acyltransferase [Legionella pneumophila subsp. pascullei]AMP91426.1 lipid A biosynthesis acyltransferase [Legionella pneumophila subsp. pascullei]AMP94414.1 lipid A biosynthesis acyltransferase [Legionella pneumophila subsp. pascullei]SQG89211.1 lipid A biosynthesis lauroyl acyltransferase [Legionella pneumophila subsp. pascullei]VEH04261.1 lipid A biosynthesis lauroyl acyltransferase [Le
MNNLAQQIEALPITLAGRFIYRFLPYRRRLIFSNISQVYNDQLNESQKKRLAKAYYSHLAKSLKEALQLRFMSEKKLQAQVEVLGHEKMLAVVAQKKGVLVVTGHFGNWEFAPLGGVLNFKEFKGQFHFIRRTLRFKFIERIMFKNYYQAGLHVIPKKNSLEQVCVALEQNHAVIFVLDQHASLVNRDGIAVEFFGKKAGTYRSLATISRHTGIPVIPAASYRLPNGKHVLEFHDPIPWKDYETTQESLYRNTLAYNQALEKIILAHPEQWNWMHKRWKLS